LRGPTGLPGTFLVRGAPPPSRRLPVAGPVILKAEAGEKGFFPARLFSRKEAVEKSRKKRDNVSA